MRVLRGTKPRCSPRNDGWMLSLQAFEAPLQKCSEVNIVYSTLEYNVFSVTGRRFLWDKSKWMWTRAVHLNWFQHDWMWRSAVAHRVKYIPWSVVYVPFSQSNALMCELNCSHNFYWDIHSPVSQVLQHTSLFSLKLMPQTQAGQFASPTISCPSHKALS